MNYIYFLYIEEFNAIKIGTTKNLNQRLSDIQVGWPIKVYYYFIVEGDYKLEKQLHKQFAKERLMGEWFKFSKRIKQFIKDNSDNAVPNHGLRINTLQDLMFDLADRAKTALEKHGKTQTH